MMNEVASIQSIVKASLLLTGAIAGQDKMERSKDYAKAPLKRMKFIHSLIQEEIKLRSTILGGEEDGIDPLISKL